jgi:hypothetical protein
MPCAPLACLAVALGVVHGRVIAADGGPLDSVRVIADWGGVADTVSVTPLGTFQIAERVTGSDAVEILVTWADGDPRYYPVRFATSRTGPDREPRLLHVLLVPRRWRITTGRFAGIEIPIDPAAAIRRAPNRGGFGRIYGERVVGWTRESFPIPIVFPRDPARPLSRSDSAAFWDAAYEVEGALGRRLFKPWADTLLVGTIYPTEVRIDRSISGDGITYIAWNREGDLFDGSIKFKSASRIHMPGIVAHELLHLLGFGHTAAWPSALEAKITVERGVTAEDAAYAQLLMRVRELEETTEFDAGLREASDISRGAL